MGLLKPVFRGLTGLAIAGAVAGTAVANDSTDTPITNASISIPEIAQESSCEKWQKQSLERQLFPVVCAENMSEEVVIQGAKDSSNDQLMIVVWGGNHELQLEGIKVAHAMHKDDKSVAIAFGPDRDGSELSAQYDLYAKGGQAINSAGNVGIQNIGEVSSVFAPIANDAYNKNFVQRIASNTQFSHNLR